MRDDNDMRQRDQVTLDLLIQGHPDGLRRLLGDHAGQVRAFLKIKFVSVLDSQERDEALALAAVRLCQSAPRLDATHELRAWFAAAARNSALMLLVKQLTRRFVPLEVIDASLSGLATNQAEAERMRLLFDVYRCINLLPPVPRAVLLADLHSSANQSVLVLAERFGKTVKEVADARLEGRQLLRKQLLALGYGADLMTDQASNQTPEVDS